MNRPDLAKVCQQAYAFLRLLVSWFWCNSLAPVWLPPRWRQPVIGYVLAIMLTLVALALEMWAIQLFPNVSFG